MNSLGTRVFFGSTACVCCVDLPAGTTAAILPLLDCQRTVRDLYDTLKTRHSFIQEVISLYVASPATHHWLTECRCPDVSAAWVDGIQARSDGILPWLVDARLITTGVPLDRAIRA